MNHPDTPQRHISTPGYGIPPYIPGVCEACGNDCETKRRYCGRCERDMIDWDQRVARGFATGRMGTAERKSTRLGAVISTACFVLAVAMIIVSKVMR